MLSSVHKQNFFEFKMHFIVCLSLSSTAQVKMDLGDQIPVNGCPLMTNWQLLTNQVIQKIMKKRYNVHVSQPQKISWSKLEGKMKKRKNLQASKSLFWSSSVLPMYTVLTCFLMVSDLHILKIGTFAHSVQIYDLKFAVEKCCQIYDTSVRHICSVHTRKNVF